jgi:enterochelin esterase-like enzyme
MVSVKLTSSALIFKLKYYLKTPMLMLILFCTFYPATTLSQGTVVQDSLFSNSLGRYKKVNVYLPEGYNHDQRRYSVIYFLHGGLGNHNSHGFIYGILDSLISNQIIEPVIVVKPDGSQGPYQEALH